MFLFLETSVVLLTLVQLSRPQLDPLTDFCRRFGHATAVVDDRLFIDGGLINFNPISQNPENYSNPYLIYASLNVSNQGMPQQYEKLTKNSTIPDVSGEVLWADDVNKVVYQFGGEYSGDPAPYDALPIYDALLNQWNQTDIPASLNRVSFGAGVAVNERAEGYYLGGWLNNQTTTGWTGGPIATGNLIKYDMIGNIWTNNTGPGTGGQGRAEGVMVFLPASDNGLLIYFGGIIDPSRNGTMVASPMSEIYIFDILSENWYNQTASGDIPDSRRRFCAGATWADDHSSYNIYTYGGLSIPPNGTAFDDVYILTLPSFEWIKWWPVGPDQGHPHHTMTCNVINRSQMLIIGGTFPLDEDCDVPNTYGEHNLNLGANGPENSKWDLFYPNITTYQVPPDIIAKVGGGPGGGATVVKPLSNWDDPDLLVYFSRIPDFPTRTPTRAIPGSTSTSKPSGLTGSRKLGVIIGASLGGLVVIAALLGICLCCLHRAKKRRAESRVARPQELPTSPIPELYADAKVPGPYTTHPFGAGAGQPQPYYAAHSEMYHDSATTQTISPRWTLGGPQYLGRQIHEIGGSTPAPYQQQSYHSRSNSYTSTPSQGGQYSPPPPQPPGVFPLGPYYVPREGEGVYGREQEGAGVEGYRQSQDSRSYRRGSEGEYPQGHGGSSPRSRLGPGRR